MLHFISMVSVGTIGTVHRGPISARSMLEACEIVKPREWQ